MWGYDDCLLGTYPDPASFLNACGYASPQAQQNSFFYMLLNPHEVYQRFNRIFMEIQPANLVTYAPQLQQLLAAAHANGFVVELLNDNTTYVTTTEAAADAMALCTAINTYNLNAPANARLDGMHWDLEPQTLAGWTSNTAGGNDPYNNLYESNMINIFTSCKATFAANSFTTTVSWDASVFYPRFASDLMTPLINGQLLTYITIMDYYNTEAQFMNGVGLSGGVLQVFKQMKNYPAIFVADTTSTAPSSQTWWNNGSLPLENMFGDVGDTYATLGPFLGLGVHEFDSYIRLQPYGPELTPACSTSSRTITITPNGVYVGSIGVYNANSGAYITYVNVAGPGPYVVTATAAGPYTTNLWDGPNLSRLNLDSLVYVVSC